jgi:hypothetical protein
MRMKKPPSTDNIIPFPGNQDKDFNDAYANVIALVSDLVTHHPKITGEDWVSMFSSLTGQLIFNTDEKEYKANFIRGVAGMVTGVQVLRKSKGLPIMETRTFLEYVQLPK